MYDKIHYKLKKKKKESAPEKKKIKSKLIKDLSVSPETTELLKGKIGGKLLDISLADDFLDLTPRAK